MSGVGAVMLPALATVGAASAVLIWPWGRRPARRGAGRDDGPGPGWGQGRGPGWGRGLDYAGAPPGGRLDRIGELVGRAARGRPDAPSLGRRLGGTVAATLSVGLWAARWSDPVRWGVWVALPFVAAVVVVALGLLEPAAARRRRLRLVLDLPQALDLLAAGLVAGRPLRSATAAVVDVLDGPLADDLAEVVAAVRLGRPEAEAWNELRRHPVLGPIATDLARSAASGTRLVEVLGVHARVARRLRQAELEAMAKAVGVRCLTPLMVCFLPAFLLVGVVPIIGSVLAAAFR